MRSIEKGPANLAREVARQEARRQASSGGAGAVLLDRGGSGLDGKRQGALFDPLQLNENHYGGYRTVSRMQAGRVPLETLRRVAGKCFIIQQCILNVQRKARPFFKLASGNNAQGFVLRKKGELLGELSEADRLMIRFIEQTGTFDDPDREDTFVKYAGKIIRDLLEIDQIASEVQYTRGGEACAYWAVDGATIERVIAGEREDREYEADADGGEERMERAVRYAQVIDGIPHCFYTADELIFDFQNPRTDVRYSFYGYSYVEQSVDLVASVINAFAYNAGFFTENKLPRGMLLIDGESSQETVEMMEDYLVQVMSGNVGNQWRIPIVPSGFQKGDGGKISWVSLASSNREMEFQSWLDFLYSNVAAIFGTTLEDLGIHSSKSQPMFDNSKDAVIKETKSLILGDTLSFLQNYLNRILARREGEYSLEFTGYEKLDAGKVLEQDKTEVESFKTLNEKRAEKGLEKLDADWANIPLNVQAVQMYQSAKQDQQGDGGDDDGYDEDEYEDDEGGGAGQEGEDGDSDGADGADGETEKSLGARRAHTKGRVIRIRV